MNLLFSILIIAQSQTQAVHWRNLPPPRDVTEYSVYTQNGKGYTRMIVDTATYKGKPALRLISITGISNVKKLFVMRDSTILYLDRDTFRPFYSTRFVKRPGYKLSYEATYDDKVSIKLNDNGKRKDATYNFTADMYDNQEIFLLLRRFPQEKGAKGEIADVIPSAVTFVKMQIENVGDAKVKNAEGDKVDVVHLKLTMLDRKLDVYVEKKPPYRVVRYEDPSTGIVMALRKKPTGRVPKD